MVLVDHECRDPAPGRDLVSDRNEENGRETKECTRVLCDEHLGTRISKHHFEPVQ